MLSLYHSAAAWVVSHPTLSVLVALTFAGTLAHLVKANAQPGSKVYHAADAVAHLCSNILGAISAVRALLGKPPLPAEPPTPAPSRPVGFARAGFLPLLALISLALGATGCKHLTPYESRLLDCGSKELKVLVAQLVPQIPAALAGGGWAGALDVLLVDAGDAVICAVEVTAQQLEALANHTPGASSVTAIAGTPHASTMLVRARSWVEATQHDRHVRVSVGVWGP